MGNTAAEEQTTDELEQKSHGQLAQAIRQKIGQKFSKNSAQAQQYKRLFDDTLKTPAFNRALGCLFGAFIGDALGAYCEFNPNINDKLIKVVMKMPGGGTYGLKPGQFTDDSQMASHLTLGLLHFEPKKPLKQQIWQLTRCIALQYIRWIKNEPFDVGLTCRKGISRLEHHKQMLEKRDPSELPGTFQTVFEEVLQHNKESESNGSLMRIAPMALFFTFLSQNPHSQKELIQNQIKLIHPKPVLQSAGFVWVNALFKVINRKEDSEAAFRAIYKQLQTLPDSEAIQEWFKQSKKEAMMNGKLNIGWAKIAWTYGMKLLYSLGNRGNENLQLNSSYYRKIIKEVISEAGDTDTNAAIVGGMLGALVGFTNLPSQYLHKMISLKFEENELFPQQARPTEYEPFQVLVKSLQLLKKCQDYKQMNSNTQL